MRPENANVDLFLCCARTSAAPADVREIAGGDIDWEYVFQLARRHSIVPLVYVQLQQHAPDLVPQQFLNKLKKHYFENSARPKFLTAELCRVINLFRSDGIDASPYKLSVLALFAYGNLALRRFVDLDVIVKKSDVF